jgi:hypothetical protein
MSNLYTHHIRTYLQGFQDIPFLRNVSNEEANELFLQAHMAYAVARIADALEQRNTENDTWLAVASKLADILRKVETMEKEIAMLFQAISTSQEAVDETDPVLRDVLADETAKFDAASEFGVRGLDDPQGSLNHEQSFI